MLEAEMFLWEAMQQEWEVLCPAKKHSQKTLIKYSNCILQDKKKCVYRRSSKLMNRAELLVANSLPQNCQVSEFILVL